MLLCIGVLIGNVLNKVNLWSLLNFILHVFLEVRQTKSTEHSLWFRDRVYN